MLQRRLLHCGQSLSIKAEHGPKPHEQQYQTFKRAVGLVDGC